MAEHSASTASPKLKLKMKSHKPNKAATQEDTFLADSSSCNEDPSGRATPSSEVGAFGEADETPRAASVPTALDFPRPPNARSKSDGVETKSNELLGPSPGSANARASTPSQSASEVEMEDDGWILTAASPRKDQTSNRKTSPGRSRRVWLEPTSSEERLADGETDDLTLPLEGARSVPNPPSEKELPTSPPEIGPTPADGIARPAASLPTLQIETQDSEIMPAILEHRVQDPEPSHAERERALRIFSGDDPSVHKGTAAAVLGDVTAAATRIRKAFMDLFEWTGLNVLAAMRDLCGKLVLRAETQQVDRILMSLSDRWCECNPNHGFKAIGKCHPH